MPTDTDWEVWAPFALRDVRLAAGETLFRQGDAAACLFFLHAGRIALLRHSSGGHALRLHVARAGETCAEGALHTDTYHCDAVADLDTHATALDKQALLAAMRADPPLAARVLARVTRQLHHARLLAELRNIRSATERTLTHLRLNAGASDTVVFDRPLAQVADELGLAHEVYYRALAALEEAGTIAREGRTVRLTGA